MTKSSGRVTLAALYLFASLAAAAVSLPAVIILTRLARLALSLAPALGDLRYSPRLFDSAAFAFSGALSALAQYYLAGLLALYRANRWFHYGCAAGAALVCGWFFYWVTGKSRLGLYPLCWLPAALGGLIGAAAAFLQEEEDNPWPYSWARYFPQD